MKKNDNLSRVKNFVKKTWRFKSCVGKKVKEEILENGMIYVEFKYKHNLNDKNNIMVYLNPDIDYLRIDYDDWRSVKYFKGEW